RKPFIPTGIECKTRRQQKINPRPLPGHGPISDEYAKEESGERQGTKEERFGFGNPGRQVALQRQTLQLIEKGNETQKHGILPGSCKLGPVSKKACAD